MSSVSPGQGPSQLAASTLIEATGTGEFDLVFRKEDLCSGSASSATQATSLWTRIPAGALLTLNSGHLLCTLGSGGAVMVGGRAVLNSDGSVSPRDSVGEIIGAGGPAANQFVVDYDGSDKIQLHAYKATVFRLKDGRLLAVNPFEQVALSKPFVSDSRVTNKAFGGTEVATFNKQSEVVR